MKDKSKSKEYDTRVAFQVCIKPNTYSVGESTIPGSTFDPKVPDKEIEWSTKRRGVIILVGVLVKIAGEGITEETTTEELKLVTQIEPVHMQRNSKVDKVPATFKEKKEFAKMAQSANKEVDANRLDLDSCVCAIM